MATYDADTATLESASAGLAEVLRSSDPRTAIPSCPGWTMTDLGGHVADIHRWVLGQLTGAEPPAVADETDLATRFTAGADALVAALRERGPDDACPAIYPPDSAATWARRQAHETVIHLWDARNAVGAAPRLQADTAADGVREVLEDLYPRQVRLGRVEPLAATVVIAFSDAAGTGTLAGTAGGAPAVRVTGRAEDLLLVLWGRRELDAVALTIDGDRAAFDAALATKLVP
ncbi:maleylpyruvate isomerase family mycothiol-dependent enzyme [Curtobacterium sp. MCBA15_008]|uniref:maleylpyruvate isomerase family mycothiol-dependent enzyme n=1 Tax=Curtobacterium sp. MCBA15_008 TaxID=1898736 RepID=UPI0008DDF58D|nr:maleylpyruvate isomerase family mycothiol-dependent enzyme [Curtobacterium sp. MCBA15_008]OII14657.1 hypothetical protein BIU96_10840 [Curtobacterium sp. MCBA15_008]